MRFLVLCTLILSGFCVGPAAAQDSVSLPLSTTLSDVQRVPGPDGDRFVLSSAASPATADTPALPTQSYCLVIPAQSQVRDVILSGGKQVLVARAGELHLAATSPAALKATTFAEKEVEYVGDAWWHGRHLIYLRVHPLRLDPNSGDLTLREPSPASTA